MLVQMALPPSDPTWEDPALGLTHRVFLDPKLTDLVVESWKTVANRYKGNPTVWGYDLLNETVLRVPPAPDCPDWEGLATILANTIHNIDPNVKILVQPEVWWGTNAFNKLRPINAPNIVYSPHVYAPFALTHQGITERKSLGLEYPGTVDGVYWDKARIREALLPVVEFQKAYGVPMFVTEFSCIRWAENGSQARWIKDNIDVFEEFGWDWTYHGVDDWDGWQVGLGEDPANITPIEDASKRVLLEALSKNLKK